MDEVCGFFDEEEDEIDPGDCEYCAYDEDCLMSLEVEELVDIIMG